jgi:hypothetical protein
MEERSAVIGKLPVSTDCCPDNSAEISPMYFHSALPTHAQPVIIAEVTP